MPSKCCRLTTKMGRALTFMTYSYLMNSEFFNDLYNQSFNSITQLKIEERQYRVQFIDSATLDEF